MTARVKAGWIEAMPEPAAKEDVQEEASA